MGVFPGGFQYGYRRSHCTNAPLFDGILRNNQEVGDAKNFKPPRRIGDFTDVGFFSFPGDNKFLAVVATRFDQNITVTANDLDAVVSRTIFRSRTLADKIRVFQNQDTAGVDAVGVAVRVIVDGFRVAKIPTTK